MKDLEILPRPPRCITAAHIFSATLRCSAVGARSLRRIFQGLHFNRNFLTCREKERGWRVTQTPKRRERIFIRRGGEKASREASSNKKRGPDEGAPQPHADGVFAYAEVGGEKHQSIAPLFLFEAKLFFRDTRVPPYCILTNKR